MFSSTSQLRNFVKCTTQKSWSLSPCDGRYSPGRFLGCKTATTTVHVRMTSEILYFDLSGLRMIDQQNHQLPPLHSLPVPPRNEECLNVDFFKILIKYDQERFYAAELLIGPCQNHLIFRRKIKFSWMKEEKIPNFL